MSIATDTKKLKTIVKESIKEVLALEFMKLRADLLPHISEYEQKEVMKMYGKPKGKAARSEHVSV